MILDDIRQDILQLCTKEGKCEISDSEREQIAAFIYGIPKIRNYHPIHD